MEYFAARGDVNPEVVAADVVRMRRKSPASAPALSVSEPEPEPEEAVGKVQGNSKPRSSTTSRKRVTAAGAIMAVAQALEAPIVVSRSNAVSPAAAAAAPVAGMNARVLASKVASRMWARAREQQRQHEGEPVEEEYKCAAAAALKVSAMLAKHGGESGVSEVVEGACLQADSECWTPRQFGAYVDALLETFDL